MTTTSPLSADERAIAKEELTIHYDQLKALDDHIYRYSSVFFTINAALLAFLAQLLTKDKPLNDPLLYLFLCFLGYASAVGIGLIAYKGYFTWEIKSERVRALEDALGYKIDEAYRNSHLRVEHGELRYLSISKIRVLFNALLGAIWLLLILCFPLLTNVNLVQSWYCLLYPIIVPLLIVIPLGIVWGSAFINRTKKG
jgi:hypothetical protein